MINIESWEHEPNFIIQSNFLVIPSIIMSNKGNVDITKNMGAGINQSITVMIKVESHISLTKRTRLNGSETHSQMLSQEVINHIADACKGYLVIGEGIDCHNGKITLQTGLSTQDCSGDWPSSLDHHPIETS